MMRTASSVAMLIAVVAWLVLSYWPTGAAALPVIAFGPWLPAPGLVTAVFAITAAIQVWIVYATLQPLVQPANAAQADTLRQYKLGIGAEALLTAAPLLITAVLAALVVLAAR